MCPMGGKHIDRVDCRMVIDQLYEKGVDVGTVGKMVGQSPKIALKYYRRV